MHAGVSDVDVMLQDLRTVASSTHRANKIKVFPRIKVLKPQKQQGPPSVLIETEGDAVTAPAPDGSADFNRSAPNGIS